METCNLIPSLALHFPNYNEYRNSAQCQVFSVPDSIIYWISKNPSNPNVYQRLIHSCKYFFIKNPILVIRCLKYSSDAWRTCPGPDTSCRFCASVYDKKLEFLVHHDKKFRFLLTKISSRIWLVKHFSMSLCYTYLASKVAPKIYKSEAVVVEFKGQTLFFNEFLMYTKNAETVYLEEATKIVYKNGSEVPCENILANLPRLKHFSYTFNNETAKHASTTFKELIKIPNFKNMRILTLFNVEDSFDIDAFCEYMKMKKTTHGSLIYNYNLPLSNAYKLKLQGIVDELLTKESFEFFRFIFVFQV